MVERFDFIESSNIMRVSLKFKCQVFDFCFDILDIQITQAGESVLKKVKSKIFLTFMVINGQKRAILS